MFIPKMINFQFFQDNLDSTENENTKNDKTSNDETKKTSFFVIKLIMLIKFLKYVLVVMIIIQFVLQNTRKDKLTTNNNNNLINFEKKTR